MAVTLNGEVMVADSKNRRVQTFTRRKLFKDTFDTNDEPCTLAVDIHYNVIVATMKRTIEIYRRGGKLVNRFGTFASNQVGLCHSKDDLDGRFSWLRLWPETESLEQVEDRPHNI